MPNIPSFEDAKQAVKDRIPENIKERIPSNVDEFVEKIPYADKINTVADKLPKVIGPKTHAIIDFAVAGSFLAMGAMWLGSHKRAAIGSFICGGAALTNSLLTDYPGGVADVISFETHGKIDVGLAAATALMPRVARRRWWWGSLISAPEPEKRTLKPPHSARRSHADCTKGS